VKLGMWVDSSPVAKFVKVTKLAIFKMYLLHGYWSGNRAKYRLWIYRYL